MTRSISLLLSRTGGLPGQGSVGFVNDAIKPILDRCGWDVRPFCPPDPIGIEQAMLPFAVAEYHMQYRERGIADVALFDDAGTALNAPSRRWAKKNVMLYHGLAYGLGTWLANPEFDLHCANSPYLARVLRALFAFPDWQHRRCLDPRAFNIVTDLRLPLPCVAEPDGSPAFSHGAEIPPAVQRLLDGNVILGHALQARKQDWTATASILYCLNELAKAHGAPPVRLLVAQASIDSRVHAALESFLAPNGYRCDDFFVPVPHLNQRALFRLVRSCQFGLAYNRFPEPFGFYVLESVYNGCPVYTNGAGNNRFLLPPDHGIVVHETPAMAGSPEKAAEVDAFSGVARMIYAGLARPDEVRAHCRQGRLVIDQTCSMAAFERSLLKALDGLESSPGLQPDFDTLKIALSPTVRSLDFASGCSLNDYASGVLDPRSVSALQQLLGKFCGDLDGDEMSRIEAEHGLFRRGLLTLLPETREEFG